MDNYRVSGHIMLEGQGEDGVAYYDFEMEADYYPNEMDVLEYMMQSGIIQIIHEDTELVEDEEDE